jgi:hypothetical protein
MERTESHSRSDNCTGHGGRDEVRVLGFPSDLIGARSPPHLATLLSLLWNLPTHEKKSYGGGWFSSLIRPLLTLEEWPRVGIDDLKHLKMRPMEQKGQNPNCDHWTPRGAQHPLSVWGRNRNLSWRLRPPHSSSEAKLDQLGSSSGDGESSLVGFGVWMTTQLKD